MPRHEQPHKKYIRRETQDRLAEAALEDTRQDAAAERIRQILHDTDLLVEQIDEIAA